MFVLSILRVRPAFSAPGILSKRRTAAGRAYTETAIARFDWPERFGPSFPNPTLRHPRAHMRIARPAEAEMVIRKSDDTDLAGHRCHAVAIKTTSFSFARFSDAPIRDKNVARILLSPRDKTQEDSNRSLLRSNRRAIFRSHGSYPGTALPCKGLHPSFERAESELPVRIEPSYSDEFRPAARLFPMLVFCRASTASTLGRQTDRQTDSPPRPQSSRFKARKPHLLSAPDNVNFRPTVVPQHALRFRISRSPCRPTAAKPVFFSSPRTAHRRSTPQESLTSCLPHEACRFRQGTKPVFQDSVPTRPRHEMDGKALRQTIANRRAQVSP